MIWQYRIKVMCSLLRPQCYKLRRAERELIRCIFYSFVPDGMSKHIYGYNLEKHLALLCKMKQDVGDENFASFFHIYQKQQFYQFSKPFYQLSKFPDFDTKISGEKYLPIKSLVNSNVDIPQTSINSGLPQKVRKTDGNVIPFFERFILVIFEELQRNLRLFC